MKEGIWGIGGMILRAKQCSTWSEIYPNATFSTTNPTRSGLGLNLDLHSGRMTTNCLNHDTAWY